MHIHNLEKHIVYEDDDMVVLDKPAGIVVNSADSTAHTTIQDWFQQRAEGQVDTSQWQSMIPDDFNSEFGKPEDIFSLRGGVVHRLDKDTSGVLVVAKNPGALIHLLAQFKKRDVQKEYVCLVHGKVGVEKDVIDLPISRAHKDRKTFAVAVDGRNAITAYTVLEYFPHFNEAKWLEMFKSHQLGNINYHYQGNHKQYFKIYQGFSLVKCEPHTGRTHQIRVHMAHIHHPLVGDSTYTGQKRKRADALWCPRQFLHAQKLTIIHPRSQEKMTFEAELPEDLKTAMDLIST